MNREELKETKFYSFVEDFFKKNGKSLDEIGIHHQNAIPFDSVDRFIALYMIEAHPDIIALDLSEIKSKEQADDLYNSQSEEFKDWYSAASGWAYDNYEREWMSHGLALYHIIREAKMGSLHVLRDSYGDGGWFGAS